MPRFARSISPTGYYHVVLRGNNKLIIFEEGRDYYKCLDLMDKYAKELGVIILSYCLMNNHIHLMIYDKNCSISLFIQKLTLSYCSYYNKRNIHCGHLFQGRYFSKPIKDKRQLLATFRYILNNPVEAGICAASDYAWSNYGEYVNGNLYTNLDWLREQIGDEKQLIEFLKLESEEDKEIREPSSGMISDAIALRIIREKLSVNSGVEIQQWSKENKAAAIRTLKREGLSVRQISRLTGVGRGLIQKA